MDIAAFRQDMPEFADTTKYPDAWITMFLNLADVQLGSKRWDSSIIDYATELFVAHHLVMREQQATTANAGGTPGSVQGPTTSKSVDSVSVSYDTQSTVLEQAGHWNNTTYGVQFLQLARMVGAGPKQLI